MPHRSVSRSGGPPPPVPPLRGGAQSCSRQPAAGLGLTLGLIAMLSQPLASAAAPATGTGAASAPTRSEASAATPGPVAPYSSAAFQKLLNHGTLEELAEGCQRVYASDQLDRLRKLRERLLLIHPAPQPLPVVLANAEVLLRCRQPNAALTVQIGRAHV